MDPIEVKLKSSLQVAIARMQDLVVESLLSLNSAIVLHGGTAIWRCYNGKRFSYDLDIYVSKLQKKEIYNRLTWELSKRNLLMGYSTLASNVIIISNNEAKMKLKMKLNARIKSIQREFERADGSFMFVNTLSAESFILEKINAYESRRYERDLYDIYYLVSTQGIGSKTKSMLRTFLNRIVPPVDKGSLKDIVYEGVAPSYNALIEGIKLKLDE